MGNCSEYFWCNGEILPIASATIPILSHGLCRGSAIFEVFGIHPGKFGHVAFRVGDHIERLYHSASLFDMTIPYSHDHLMGGLSELVKICDLPSRSLIKIVAYWENEEPIHLLVSEPVSLAIFAIPQSSVIPLDNIRPVSACLSSWKKLHPQTVPVQAKACAYYINGYLAQKEAHDRGYDIAVLADHDNNLAEGPTESVFMIKGGVIHVPPLKTVLDSISRKTVLAIARELVIPVVEKPIAIGLLEKADELFVSNSAAKIVPVARYEKTELEAPGPVTQMLLQEFQALLKYSDQRYPQWFTTLIQNK